MTRRSDLEQTVTRIVLGEGAAGGLPADLHAQATSDPVVGSTGSGQPVYGTYLGSEVDLAGPGNERFSHAIRQQYDRSPVKSERDLYKTLSRASKDAVAAHVRAHSAGYSAKDHYEAAQILHGHARRLMDEASRRTYSQGASTLYQLSSSYDSIARAHMDEARKRRDKGEPGVPQPSLRLELVPGTATEQREKASGILARGGRPIAIESVGRGKWRVLVLGTPIGEVKTKELARSAAHQIGQYRLHLGDLAYGYVEGW